MRVSSELERGVILGHFAGSHDAVVYTPRPEVMLKYLPEGRIVRYSPGIELPRQAVNTKEEELEIVCNKVREFIYNSPIDPPSNKYNVQRLVKNLSQGVLTQDSEWDVNILAEEVVKKLVDNGEMYFKRQKVRYPKRVKRVVIKKNSMPVFDELIWKYIETFLTNPTNRAIKIKTVQS